MSELIIWSSEETEELFHLVVKLFNACATRNKLIEKIQKRTGVRCNFHHSDSKFNTGSEVSTEIRSFSRSNEDKVGNLIDKYLNKKFIIKLLPITIKRAFFAFSSLKETSFRKSNNRYKENELKMIEYNLMITSFTESIVYCCADKIMDEVKNNYSSSTNDISRWASPYLIKDIINKIDNQMLYELNEYGITMKSAWLGEEERDNLNKTIIKMDYQGLFSNNSSKKSSFETKFRFITLESHYIRDEMLFYFETIKHLPNELNAKLGGNLNLLSKSIYILSIESKNNAFIIEKNSESFIPGSKIGIIYFPCKNKISVNCQNNKTKKFVELELFDDKLLIIDLNKNKYTFRNTGTGIVTYCILTYIFGPT